MDELESCIIIIQSNISDSKINASRTIYTYKGYQKLAGSYP